MILVVGATGKLGLDICRRLRERGTPVRALVRPGSPGEHALRDIGADVMFGDLKDPASLDAAADGVPCVITTANAIVSRRAGDSMERVDRDGSLALVAAARRAGVPHFVYLSASPRLPGNNPFIRYKRAVEAAVRSSGMAWTILQPAGFMDVHAGPPNGWDFARGRARITGTGRVPLRFIAQADVAAVTAAVAGNPQAFGRNLHLTGPDPLTGLDAVATAERVIGRRFKVQRAPVGVLRVAKAVLQPVNPVLASLLGMAIGGAEHPEETDMTGPLREFGIEPTPFEQYVERAGRI